MIKRLILGLLMLGMVAPLLLGCGGGGDSEGIAMSVSPAQVRLSPGETFQFTSRVTGITNTAVTWQVYGSAASIPGGSITDDGLYTAPNGIGTFTIIAISKADPTMSAVASVSVSAEPYVEVHISPATASVPILGTVQFTADVDGIQDQSVVWLIKEGEHGGTINDGLYTAPAHAGTYHILAVSLGDPAHTQAEVAVTVLPTLTVTPTSPTVSVRGAQQFTATVLGTSNTAVTWEVAEEWGGTITATGRYIAPSTPGNYHITATSQYDPSVQVTIPVTVVSGSASGTIQ